jgi:hypothetical protein
VGLLPPYLRVSLGIIWAFAPTITYVLAVIDTWQTGKTAAYKISLNITLDIICAAFWPITWIYWLWKYRTGKSSPIARLFG